MAPAQKKKWGVGGTIFFMVCCAAVIIGIYLSITRGKDRNTLELEVKETEADVLLGKDLEKSYPPTAREVLKLYSRITKCIYNDELSPDTTRKLMGMLRELYTDELRDNNREEDQLALLLGEVTKYHNDKMTIYSYTIDSGANARKIETVAGSTTLINMYFTIRSEGKMDRAYEEFSLVLDDKGRWKIAAWRPTEETNVSDED